MTVRRPALLLRPYPLFAVMILFSALLAFAPITRAQETPPDAYNGLRWRFLGTHRGGRITSVAGVVGQPNLYYVGTPNGGVWKTDDGGRTWKPIFDSIPVPSVGALAVASSNTKIIYVATGEQGKGGGIFKSTDAGETWASAGLADNTLFDGLVVDPQDPDVVIAGASGRGREEPRGLYKTVDGGKTWKKTFVEAEVNAGVADVTAAADSPKILYAALYPVGAPPQGERGVAAEARVLLSQDEGSSWTVVAGAGLPEKGRGRIGVAVIPGTSGKSVLAILNQGLFRSDDAGATWQKSTNDPRILGSGYFSKVYVDPNQPKVVYVMQTCSYRSNDGGKTFFAFRGAPSGEDHHVIWIAPDHSRRMILGTDQGAIVSMNEGATWTDWLNQPTGQLYHVTTDNQFPYHAYAAQQDSGTIVVPNRSDYGQISYRDWFSSGGFESGYIAPDPLNKNLVYSVGWFGTVLRLDRVTGQIATVYVPPSDYKTVWETPLVYSPRDPHTLYYGTQYLLKTSDGAITWTLVSPDLSNSPQHPAEVKKPSGGHEPDPDGEAAAGETDRDSAQFARAGAIHTIAPSPREDGLIWAGTSNGLIRLFRADTWQDVTPDLPKGSDVAVVEASAHDANTAFAVVKVRRDDHPYIFRTHDAGKTWTKIVAGLPEDVPAEAVREDVKRKGLLFSGTQRSAYVSFDDGDHWQTLQFNLPPSPVTDFSVHGDDLVASTFGRGLWILDDIAPLRELSGKVISAPVHFFKPQTALRIRWDNHEETPLSPEFPASPNPPDGAILDYFLKTAARGEVTLDVLDTRGNRIRHYSSNPPAASVLVGNAPDIWFAPPAVLQTSPGLHRFIWDLRAEDPLTLTYGYFGGKLEYIEYTLPDHSVPGLTPRQQPPGPLVPPGVYTAVLKVDGREYRQLLQVDLDPRVPTAQSDLQAQWNLAAHITAAMSASYAAYNDYAALQAAIDDRRAALVGKEQSKDVLEALERLQKSVLVLGEGSDEKGGIGPANRDLSRFLVMVESADMKPAASARKAATDSCAALQKSLQAWQKLNTDEVPGTNKLLENIHLAALPIAPARPELFCSD
ncbi:MAG TPA: hypothetical protein VN749_20260 [Candidatus Eisenbacteria bacterium]|nr:hypothetical protein [Candidatus Eisenbacteria bacterium]